MGRALRPILAFKPGVELDIANLDPGSIDMLRSALTTAPDMVGDLVVVTSASDGEHGQFSLHFVGRAWDIRFLGDRPGAIAPDVTGDDQKTMATDWARRMQTVLGIDYDVVTETDHIHVELDVGV